MFLAGLILFVELQKFTSQLAMYNYVHALSIWRDHVDHAARYNSYTPSSQYNACVHEHIFTRGDLSGVVAKGLEM